MSAPHTPARRSGTRDRPFTISQAAECLRVRTHTLRFYESEGLVVPNRTNGGQRRYYAEDVETLRELLELRLSTTLFTTTPNTARCTSPPELMTGALGSRSLTAVFSWGFGKRVCNDREARAR